MTRIILKPIGIIHSPYKEIKDIPCQGYRAGRVGEIEVYEKYKDGLKDIKGFSHLIILYYFHMAKPYSLLSKPFLHDEPKGIFAIRGPNRPNHIGISVVKLLKVKGHIYDIRLETSWILSDLTLISGAPGTGHRPFGYVRNDGINAILYNTSGSDPGRVYELRLENGWEYYELTSVQNAVRGYAPVGFVRADGISAVIYRGEDFHIHEIRLQTIWHWADLTTLAGAPPADGFPWPYNRSTVANVYLPLMSR